ncbi:MAG: right-handed parallel beta-helix repeat-containing protein, partial [Lachnospiraceae bacterium]|nr:right-handed parallel beta-helix repeat-containing protein [Lachnospiraceae bacterium]
VESCEKPSFLVVKDAAVVQIDGSTIDCNYQCGFLKQNTGRLLVNETEFLHSAHERMIDFTGADAKFARCSFMEGRLGFICLSENAALMMLECDFFRASAEYGAAVYSDSLDNVSLTKCSFRDCKVRYLGAAVYFKYQKLGQVVKECVCSGCVPETDAVFNTYEDDFVLKIR